MLALLILKSLPLRGGTEGAGRNPPAVSLDRPMDSSTAALHSRNSALLARLEPEFLAQRARARHRQAAPRVGVVDGGEQPLPCEQVVAARRRAHPGPQRVGVLGGD